MWVRILISVVTVIMMFLTTRRTLKNLRPDE